MAYKKKADIKIAGIIIPVDWDAEQRVAEVAIATADEKEYRIRKTPRGKELFGHLQAYVEATGSLSEGKNAEDVFTVRQYVLKRPGDATP